VVLQLSIRTHNCEHQERNQAESRTIDPRNLKKTCLVVRCKIQLFPPQNIIQAAIILPTLPPENISSLKYFSLQTTIDTCCDPALLRNCVDHPADRNPFKKNNPIKFSIIRPFTMIIIHEIVEGCPGRNLFNSFFFRCPRASHLICMQLSHVCANKQLKNQFCTQPSGKSRTVLC